jgi:glucose/arabinose dehydrogenase
MKKNNKIKLLLLLLILIIVSFFYFITSIIGNENFRDIKLLFGYEQKQAIKKYILPYKTISTQQQTISKLKSMAQSNKKLKKLLSQHLPYFELNFKKTNEDIQTAKSSFKLSNNKSLEKYKLENGFYAGINNLFPGSGYIDFYENNLFILSSRGVLAFTKNLANEINFKQIQNNINEYIHLEQFVKTGEHGELWFSLKDIFVMEDKVFISYTEEITENCWNTSIIYGDINYENIEFKKLFSPKKCIHSIDNVDGEFNAHQSGGKIIAFDNDHILLSTGDYRSRYLAQDRKSVNGKIIKIDINNSNYEIISMGHRNPQGLYFDKENNFILETEHGPFGGDEINLIEVEKINRDKVQNYGWALTSAGEHYGGKSNSNIKKYEKYPLYKSHTEYGFIEPLKSFVPSIGISEIIKIRKNKYVVSSLKDRSLYFFELNKQKQIVNLERVEVFERVRDLVINKNKLYLFLEDTASIGIINLN